MIVLTMSFLRSPHLLSPFKPYTSAPKTPASQDKKLKDAPAGLPSNPVNLPKVEPSPEVVGSKDRDLD